MNETVDLEQVAAIEGDCVKQDEEIDDGQEELNFDEYLQQMIQAQEEAESE